VITDADLKYAMPSDKCYKIYTEKGLYLLVTPAGGKYFRYKYRYNRREKALSLGVYPDISLDEARKMRNEARRQLDYGIDPMQVVSAEKAKKNELPPHHKRKILEVRNKKIDLDLPDIGFYNANDVIKILGVSMPFFYCG
jgi:hypothetical protein